MLLSELKRKYPKFAKIFIIFMIYQLYKLIKKLTRKKYSIKNKVILITGGASGIGKLLAIKCKEAGAIVGIWDINDKGLSEMSNIVDFCQKCDVTSFETVENQSKIFLQKFGTIDILVNNAGVAFGKSIFDLTENQIRLTYGVNILAHYWTVKSFLPTMIKNENGHIVSLISMSGLFGAPFLTDYAATKFAVTGFEESLSRELMALGKDNGIYFTGIFPHLINTGMFAGTKVNSKYKILDLVNPGWLTPERVVNDIYNGIIYRKRKVKIPEYEGVMLAVIFFLMNGLGILPYGFQDWLVLNCGDLSDFKGRH